MCVQSVNRKGLQMRLVSGQKQRLQRAQTCGPQGGNRCSEDMGDWGSRTYTTDTVCKLGN